MNLIHRFRMQNKLNLRAALATMGISDAFNPAAADFTGMSGACVRERRARQSC